MGWQNERRATKTDNEITFALPPVSMVEYLLLLFYKIYFDTWNFRFI